jgi:acyl transferase domain-containing protein/NADPH:quinone reductase-like Zn-dependent oxidoreductase/acyl carrier protein
MALDGAGAMAAVAASPAETADRITPWAGQLTIAAVNGPAATVVSGDPVAVAGFTRACQDAGLRVRPVPVRYASHSPQVEAIRDQVLAALGPVTPRPGTIAMISAMTGRPLPGPDAGPGYWYDSLRAPVDFAAAIRELAASGHGIFIEASPHPVLTAAITGILDQHPAPVTVTGTLRRDDGGPARLASSLAAAWAGGAAVDWAAVTGPAPRTDLPGYAFQRQRYWLAPRHAAPGLDGAGGHPLLTGTLELAGGQGWVLSGRLATGETGWLADHVVGGAALFPGAGFAELAVLAGDVAGCGRVDELVLEAPLVIPAEGAVAVQVRVGAEADAGRRPVEVYSRPAEEMGGWRRHAAGVLADAPALGGSLSGQWPPPDAVPVPVDELYARMAEAGVMYGPSFLGLRAAWRHGAEVLAEVELPDGISPGTYGIHPALLDAALQAAALLGGEEPRPAMPFSWAGIVLHSRGAAQLRARLALGPGGEIHITCTDIAGGLVFCAESLVMRPVAPARTVARGTGMLLGLDWEPALAAADTSDVLLDWAVLGAHEVPGALAEAPRFPDVVALCAAGEAVPSVVVLPVAGLPVAGLSAGDDVPERVHAATNAVLDVLQQWVGSHELAGSRLVVLTQSAVSVGEDPADLVGAAVWGLVRSAQSEYPGRITLIDTGSLEVSAATLAGALSLGEAQAAIHDGRVLVPRLCRVPDAVLADVSPRLSGGPVLVTGGTGALADPVARHLVAAHGARDVVLISRRGPHAEGAASLAAGLAESGAQVRVLCCDIAERVALVALVNTLGRLAGVVHCAVLQDDAAIGSLSPARMDPVLAAKADAAWHLHELTAGMDLAVFALFSSVAGMLGNPGQASYAAANAFLDALASRRRSEGLPGVSLAWGLWEATTAMTATFSRSDWARVARSGLRAMPTADALALFDAALAGHRPVLVPLRLDIAVLRAPGASVPPLLARLAGIRARPAAATPDIGLTARLGGLDSVQAEHALTALVTSHTAAVLGHASPDSIEAGQAFRDLGLDSVTAVELRNQLSAATGLRLPAGTVFDYPTPAALAVRLLTQLRPRTEAIQTTAVPAVPVAPNEPIAVVGVACRFPGGAGSAEELWDLVAGEIDAMGGLPADRGWDAERAPGARWGGFLAGAAGFDAAFFGISPREAVMMDPQQRLMLEVCWEGLEDAGIDPARLRGSETGVFAGVISQHYGSQVGAVDGGFAMTGTTTSVVSGRVSYVFGLEGPAVTVDTACSSALVAVHLACQSLRRGECSLALAGGVTVMATPGVFAEFERQGGLAADGRCKPFAATADGTSFGEGAGLLVVERLSDAVRNRRRILGVIAGSAVNQDGASNGLTAPNGPSQQRVIRAALADARISAADVDVVEAHGTGTVLGDPIEAEALLATYGQDRGDRGPLWLGSVKSNIGHAQAAAGVAGMIKMLMALRHERMPATLHVDAPSPHVDWDGGGVALLTAARAWPRQDGRPRRAGVSSFGISGTNAHVIIAEPPVLHEPGLDGTPGGLGGVLAWPVSAKTPAALAGQAARLAQWVSARPALQPAAVAAGLAARSRFGHRAVVTGGDRRELLAGLDAVAAGRTVATVITGQAAAEERTVAFMFPGQGAQWAGMGRELYAGVPVFAEAIDEVCGLVDGGLGPEAVPLREVLLAAPGSEVGGLIDQAVYAQAGIFAVEVGLVRLLASLGVRPGFVAGHSVGEVAAAYVAGVLSLEDACVLVAARGRLMQELPSGGAMVAVEASEQEVAGLLAGREDRAAVAAVNGPRSVVLSGEDSLVGELAETLAAQGRRTRRLRVSHAFHSPLMEPMLARFAEVASGIGYAEPRIPVVSGVTGQLAGPGELSCAGYWLRNVRCAVRFGDAVAALRGAGAQVMAEVGPGGVLSGIAGQCLGDDADMVAGPVLRPGRPEPAAVAAGLAAIWVRGGGMDWAALGGRAAAAALPGYAFDRQRYWLAAAAGDPASFGLGEGGHPLLGATTELGGGQGLVLTGRLSLAVYPWLADHLIGGTVLLPGTAFVELAAAAGSRCECGRLDELVVEVPLVIPDRGGVQVQVMAGAPDQDGRRPVEVFARPDGGTGQGWTRHAVGALAPGEPDLADLPGMTHLAAWPPPGAEPVDVTGLYESVAADGYVYGPSFRGLRAVWRRDGEVFAEVALPGDPADAAGYGMHPAVLDAVLHAVLPAAGIVGRDAEPGLAGMLLPFAWSGVRVHAAGAAAVRARLTRSGGTLTVSAADSAGAPVITVESLVLRPVQDGQLGTAAGQDALFTVDWVPLPHAPVQPPTRLAVIGGPWTGATAGASVHPDIAAVVAGVAAGGAVPDAVVVLGGYGSDPGVAAGRVLGVVQGFLAADVLGDARLVVVTRGAAAVLPGEVVTGLAAAAAVGLVRSAQSENPGRLVLADLLPGEAWPGGGTDGAGGLVAAVLGSGEAEVAVRDGVVYGRRLGRLAGGLVPPGGGEAWRLEPAGTGSLDGLVITACPGAGGPLAAGQARVAVRAAGLNFRDVMITLGMYPGVAVLGSEIAGVVTGTGPGVVGLAAGDRVLGLAPGGFGPVAVTDARTLAKIPAGWSFARAAAVPVTFATAWYALADLAGARPGQRLLVHAAAGGVGMAAVTIARRLGLEVYATASPAKHAVLEDLGVDRAHIASSRDGGFETAFAAATGGAGVDIVLNALAGELADASLRLLPRGGVFLEMGKTDLRDPAGITAAHPGVSYKAFDLSDAGPDRLGQILAEVTGLLATGDLTASPVRCWDVRRAREAMRFMSQARHAGKIVLMIPPDPAAPRTPGTVLVTGGTGTLGGLVARHLAAARRARRLLLISRSGPAAPGTAALAAGIAAAGTALAVTACDAADPAALTAALASVPPHTPLTGVIHTAGILDDGLVASLTPARVQAVMRAKASAAACLDELTRGADLDQFVLFSSAAGVVGAAGQGGYAAANAFLDALAAARQAAGLPAVSVAWGLWEQASGMTANLGEEGLARISRLAGALPTGEALGLLDAAAGRDEALLVAARLDVTGIRARAAAGQDIAPLWRALAGGVGRRPAAAAAAAGAGAGAGLRERLAGLGGADRDRLLLDLVRDHAAAVAGHASGDAIEPGRAFRDLGFDSLTAVELRNRLAAAAGLKLPASVVFDYPTPRALAQHLQTRLAGVQPAAHRPTPARPTEQEPLAIVGAGCRFPGGVRDPEQLWALLASGSDAITPFPGGRGWPDQDLPGGEPPYPRAGGFVDDVADFDAAFFEISPREALAMDPQQRLMLEVGWEALERAGIDPATLRGSATGVFAGASTSDYSALAASAEGTQGYQLTGNTASVISGRVSYVFGLEGPAVTVDTACSSALVAVHLACGSLRRGECSLALAGGVTVMATPGVFAEFARQGGLAGDGRCKPFAAAADGTGWAEGAGLLVLERLGDAVRNGRRILGVIAGSAVNQDGASNGLTAPNGPSQERVIRAALADARIGPADVDVVEAHGTGTVLGDPIEAGALLATYGQDRGGRGPLWLGSVKSNIGHAQAAAGAAGMIKMVMALRHQQLPATLHVDAPSPHVDWDSGQVALLTAARDWPRQDGRTRRAGVSAFGISGTNAHLIIEEPPASPALPASPAPAGDAVAGGAPAIEGKVVAWPVSARTPGALAGQAARLAQWVTARPELTPPAVAAGLASRSRFGCRAVVTGADRGELLAGLNALAAGRAAATVVTGQAVPEGRTVTFVFPGQGAQWAGMGAELMESSTVFRDQVEECSEALEPYLNWRVAESLASADRQAPADRVDVVQAELFTMMVSLAALWRWHGVEPRAVAGHSQGEIAAAYVAGALSLADAARVVAVRGRVLATLAGSGAMAAVAVGADRAGPLIDRWEGRLELAAVNGPSAVVISGDPAAVDELVNRCGLDGIRARALPVNYASHSSRVESVRDELLAGLAGIEPRPAAVPFYSALTGALAEGTRLDAGYWYRNLRERVRFSDAVQQARRDGAGIFIECSPHPGLLAAIQETVLTPTTQAEAVSRSGVVTVGSLRRGDGGQARWHVSLAEAFAGGAPVDWRLPATQPAELPTYAFTGRRFWPDPPASAAAETDLDRWRYRVRWRPAVEPNGLLAGTWLVIAPLGQHGAEWTANCAAVLSGRGADVTVLTVDPDASRARIAAVLMGAAGLGGLGGVVSLLAAARQPCVGLPWLTTGTAATMTLIQALGDVGCPARLWLVTGQAVGTGDTDLAADPEQAQIWGIGRVAGLEHPDRWGGMVDLPATPDAMTWTRLAAVLADGVEDQVAIRPAGIFVRRLVRAPARPVMAPRSWQPRGTTMITGGTSPAGSQLARWLAGSGAASLLLTANEAVPTGSAAALAAELAELGTKASITTCEITDRGDLACVLAAIPASQPLTAVFHTAGAPGEAELSAISLPEFAGMLEEKVTGAANLDELLTGYQLDAFVLFSSISAIWGNRGQAGYAAADAYLDALAERRRSRGLAATSIAWGPWSDVPAGNVGNVGNQAQGQSLREQLNRGGLGGMATEPALAVLRKALDHDETDLVAAEVDWERFLPLFMSARRWPLFDELSGSATARTLEDDATTRQALARQLAGRTPGDAVRVIESMVLEHVSAVLGFGSSTDIMIGRPFTELGFESVSAVDLRNRLAAATGLPLAATLAFDHPTPEDLAAYLYAEISSGTETVSAVAELDRLESRVADAAFDARERPLLVSRLRTLLARLDEVGQPPQTAAVTVTVAEKMQTASDDEMFAFIDGELGAS